MEAWFVIFDWLGYLAASWLNSDNKIYSTSQPLLYFLQHLCVAESIVLN